MGNLSAKIKPRLVALWPECENVHLTKDLGMIPFILYKYHDYNSSIACYQMEEFPYLDKEVKGLGVERIENTGNILRDGDEYLIQNANTIDILFLMGIYSYTLSWINVYKTFNPDGKIYLKLDANLYWMNSMDMTKDVLEILDKCDLISVESSRLHHYLNQKWPLKIELIPNGYYNFNESNDVDFEEKENVILTVGRIGTFQKANDVLLEAFKLVNEEIPDWRIKIVGNMEETFMEYLQSYFSENPTLMKKVELPGSINNRFELEKEYRKAKVFCLTSRWEGFPLVFTEAARAGCYVISTDIDPAYDITCGGELGSLFPIDDVEKLGETLLEVCKDSGQIEKVCYEIQKVSKRNFDWVTIGNKINRLLHLS